MRSSVHFFSMLLYLVCIVNVPSLISQENQSITNSFSQPKFKHITMADGLPENSVWSIYQDHLGFLWFGTQNGLAKYDGYSIVVYKPESENSKSINSYWVRAIFEDHTKTLWIGTTNGVNRFNRITQTFDRFKVNNTDNINSNYVRCIYEDSANRLWIGTMGGLGLYNRESNNFDFFPFSHPVKNNIDAEPLPVYDILEDTQTHNLYVGTDLTGLWMFDINKKIFSKAAIQIDTMSNYIPSWILGFQQSKDEVLWMVTTNGLSRLNFQNKTLNFYQIIPSKKYVPRNLFNSVIEDRDGLIWIGSGHSGLISFDPQTEKFQVNKSDQNNPNSINNNRVWSIYEDDTGIIWAGTWGGGINKLERKRWKFNSLKHQPGIVNSLSSNTVNSICEDTSGMVWIGTDNGLNKYDQRKKSFTHFSHSSRNKNSLGSNLISVIIADRFEPGILWIGSEDNGLDKFDTKKTIFTHYKINHLNSKNSGRNSIRTMLMDHLGFIWIGTEKGLNKFDIKTGRFTRFENDPKDTASLSQNQVRALYEDPSGNIWAGTNKGGLNRYNRSTGKFTRYVSLTKEKAYSSVTSFCENDDSSFWVGTYLGGMYLFDSNNGISTQRLTPKNGLKTDNIMGILKDGNGNLWISTLNGLSRFNTETNSIKNFSVDDGLSGNDFSRGCAYRSSTGEMYFGGRNGVTFFYPENIHDDPIPPKVVISNILQFNKPDAKLTINGYIPEMDELRLSHNQNELQFDFEGLHYGEPGKNRYKYMLENFDDNWVEAGTRRNAIYTNLDPGTYVFKVKAANRDGVWSEKAAMIKIIISPPFWKTWWAYTLYVLFLLSLLYFIRRYELNRVRWKNQATIDEIKLKEREETDRMKSRFFANISHEFRTPLTLILGPAESINTNTSEYETKKNAGIVTKNARRLLKLINQLLDLSKLEAGKLELKASKSNIVSFIKGITMSFESIAERKDITLKVKADKNKIELYFDKEKMTKIMTNLLSNAFKFTPEGGEITVKVSHAEPARPADGFISAPPNEQEIPIPTEPGRNDNMIIIRVRDTGVGIADEEIQKLFDRFYQVDSSQTREHEGTGIGLALTKELVELHRGKISVSSKFGEGTEFTIVLPVGSSHLKSKEIVEVENENKVVLTPPQREKVLTELNVNYISIKDPSSRVLNAGILQNDNKSGEEKTIILIVEDNSDVREYIKDSLGEEYLIDEAVNGEQGVKKAAKIIPDLIISDVMMPKMGGNELTKILKNDERTSHIPIIILTAKAGQENKLEGLETGADAYLTKPFDTKELLVRIKNLLNIRKKLQKKYSTGFFISRTDKKKLSDPDEKFMSNVLEVIKTHLSEEDFSIEKFDREIGMGRVQIYRKLKALTGKSPSKYIRSIRLARAKKMIEENKGNISEIAYSVGFGSPAYFTRCFKEEFGFPPSDLTN